MSSWTIDAGGTSNGSAASKKDDEEDGECEEGELDLPDFTPNLEGSDLKVSCTATWWR
jgi:hypothetical protein